MRFVVCKKFYVLYVAGDFQVASILLLRLLFSISFIWQDLSAMSVYKFMQSKKGINYHDDIVLRSPVILSGEEF